MHPCDCFPEAWGTAPPVTGESFNAVPQGSDNKYTPKPVLLVMGAFTCLFAPSDYQRKIFDSQESSEESACEVLCRNSKSTANAANCNFFWDGEVLGSKQCRLYRYCEEIVRESGSEGSLMALPQSPKKYCHVANPQTCWAVTGRRNFLDANLAALEFHCAWLGLLQQCDHKLLIGGMGIKECGQCTHKAYYESPEACRTEFHCQQKAVSLAMPYRAKRWLLVAGGAKRWLQNEQNAGCWKCTDEVVWGIKTNTKCASLKCEPAPLSPVPAVFEHGRRLGVSCWHERFRAVPLNNGAKASDILTCVSGKWLDSDGKLGLTNFACAACVQVVRPSHDRLDEQNRQELYFSASIVTEIWVAKYNSQMGLLQNGRLTPNNPPPSYLRADSWLIKSEEDGLVVQSLATAGKCLASEANDDAATKDVAMTKLTSDTCDSAILRQRFASVDIPQVVQSQAIQQGLLPTPTMSNQITMGSKDSTTQIQTKLRSLSGAEIHCGGNSIGALGSMVWTATGERTTKLGLQCHPTLVDETGELMKRIDMTKHRLHFPGKDEATKSTNDFMVCPLGKAISDVQFRGGSSLNWKFKCAHVISLGSCHPFMTPDLDVSAGSSVGSVEMMCSMDEMLSRIEAENMGRESFRYRYTCCSASGLPISVMPQDRFHRTSFGVSEGIYCPESRDASGRLTFRKLKSFKEDGSARPSPFRRMPRKIDRAGIPQYPPIPQYPSPIPQGDNIQSAYFLSQESI